MPVAGFIALQGNDGNVRNFTLHGDKNVKVLPRAHTCFNRMDVPMYKTKADMKKYVQADIHMIFIIFSREEDVALCYEYYIQYGMVHVKCLVQLCHMHVYHGHRT